MRLPLQRSQPFPRVSSAIVTSDYTCAVQWERLKRPSNPPPSRYWSQVSFLFSRRRKMFTQGCSDCFQFNLSTREPPEKPGRRDLSYFIGVIVADRLMLAAANFRSCSPHMLPTLQRFPEDEQRLGGGGRVGPRVSTVIVFQINTLFLNRAPAPLRLISADPERRPL